MAFCHLGGVAGTLRYLNLGCGNRFHPDWINIDVAPRAPAVIAHDLSRGIPLPDASCDVVYHSHLLEHIRRRDVMPLMLESYRVLKPRGILRVAVPDLERICRLYIEKLEGALDGEAASAYDHEWILLEMYDQTVREQSGGRMLEYLQQNPLPNEAFVFARIGEEGRNIVRTSRQRIREETEAKPVSSLRSQAWGMLRCFRHLPSKLRRGLVDLVLGPRDSQALRIGRFRLAGEVHHWMYDRYSLGRLMRAAGFRDPIRQTATSSRIPDWPRFNLDTTEDGLVSKPDSLFMEAIRPMRA